MRMLAQEHMGFVEALQSPFGTALNDTTLAAAVASIGSTKATLLLSNSGDGVWTISNNLTIPTNIVLWIPAPVTVSVASTKTLTVNGPVISHNASWKTGAGTLVRGLTTPLEFSVLTASQVTVVTTGSGQGLTVSQGTSGTVPTVNLFTDQGGGGTGLLLSRNPTNTAVSWQILANDAGYILWSRPGSNSRMSLSDTGLGLGLNQLASFQLQLATDSAAKPGTTTWTVSSDSRVKDILGNFTDGMAFLLTLPPPKRFQYNGKAGMPNGGPVYVNMIAQDMLPVAPTWVSSYPVKLEETDPDTIDLLNTNTSNLTFVLMNAVKELNTRVLALEHP